MTAPTSQGTQTRIAGRTVGLICCVIVVLLFRMATNGTFVHLALNFDSPAWAAVSAAGVIVAGLAAGLSVALALWPRPRLLWAALIFGALIIPFSLMLVAVGHLSGTLVGALGLVIVSITGYALFVIRPPTSGR
jgi:hypothetical protein